MLIVVWIPASLREIAKRVLSGVERDIREGIKAKIVHNYEDLTSRETIPEPQGETEHDGMSFVSNRLPPFMNLPV